MDKVDIQIQVLGPGGRIPTRGFEDDAGWDLYLSKDTYIKSRLQEEVSTDIAVAFPKGWYGHIKTRSSTSARWGVHVSEGVIDAGYRGELFISVYNPQDQDVFIKQGTRIAQLIVLPVPEITWTRVYELPPSERDGGFGSTGV